MSFHEWLESMRGTTPPGQAPKLLKALWYEANGDWERAHDLAQDDPTPEGSWVHAYLHRVEGDEWNAAYWYRKAGKKMPQYDLKREWEELVRHFLA